MPEYRAEYAARGVPASSIGEARGQDAGARILPFAALALVGCVLGLSLVLADWRVTAVLLIAASLVCLTFRFPSGGVLVYLLIAEVRPEELGIAPVVMRLELVFAIVCMAALLLPVVVRGESRRWRWMGTDKTLAVLYLVCWASVPFSVSRGGAIGACWEFAKIVFAYVMVRHTATSPRRAAAVVWTLVAATAITAVLALHGSSTGHLYIDTGGVARAKGLTSTSGDPNSLANTLVAGLPMALLLAIRTQRWRARALLIGVALLDLYVTSTTGARAGVISLIVVLFLVALASRRKVVTLAGLAVILLLLWTVLPQSLRDRYSTIQNYQNEATYQQRRETAKLGFRMFVEHPVFGVGFGSFMVARYELYDHIWLQPHNAYAQVASELGLVGLCAWAAFLVVFARTGLAARAALRTAELGAAERRWLDCVCLAVLVALAGLLVQGLAGHNFMRADYYINAALATNCLQIAAARAKSPGEASKQ